MFTTAFSPVGNLKNGRGAVAERYLDDYGRRLQKARIGTTG
jgi:hypothetical protein